MNIQRVKYKMYKEDSWKIGYVIGEYDGQNKVLLDCNFDYVPKIVDNDREWLVYDIKADVDKLLNITIPL